MSAADKRNAKRSDRQWQDRIMMREYWQHLEAEKLEYMQALYEDLYDALMESGRDEYHEWLAEQDDRDRLGSCYDDRDDYYYDHDPWDEVFEPL